jgi:uncharacterized protein (TIGR03437 family)
LTVPPQLTVPAGATTVSFQATAGTVKTNQNATLRASLNGSRVTASIALRTQVAGKAVTVSSVSKPSVEGSADRNGISSSPPANTISTLACSPKVMTAGGVVTCELFVTASTGSVSVELKSSSEQVGVPHEVTTRPNQSSLTFQAQSDPASKHQSVTISAQLGGAEVHEAILVLGASAPILRVPSRQVARAGGVISFVLSVADPSDWPLHVEASAIPPGASFDPATGVFEWKPNTSQTGTFQIAFTATNEARQSSAAQVEIEVDSGIPVLHAPVSPCSTGGIASLTGKWLAAPGEELSDPSGRSFDLGGTSVLIDGQLVPILYSSAYRIDFLCPTMPTGTQLSVEAVSSFGTSQPTMIGIQDAVPAIVSLDDSHPGQGLISFYGTNDLVMERNFKAPSHPAQPGDQIVIRATGLGSAVNSGSGTMLVKLGDVYVGVDSVQPVTGYAGMYQIQLRVPAAMTFGAVPVQLEMMTPDGHQLNSNSVTAVFEAVRQ